MSAIPFPLPSDGAPPASRPRLRAIAAASFAAMTFLVLTQPVHARTGAVPESFADLAAKVTPAVVNIATVRKVTQAEEQSGSLIPQLPKDSPFSDLFRKFRQQQGPHRNQPSTPKTRALGSGFIVDPAGYVVTNNHVIAGADKITVTLQDGRVFPAKLVGRDAKTDLALLKLEGDGKLPFVVFGDSDKARVGDWVMAVGNPFGLGGTVTAGILSARSRDIQSGPYDDYLQIDASINRGNSGGPLFDMDGKVIGINTAIFSPNGGSVGIGFAIPASIASSIIKDLREHGQVERGWIGVRVQPMTDELAKALGVKETVGALVAQVEPNSPAAKAGVRSGDVLISLDGQRIRQFKDLARFVASTKLGKEAKLLLVRDGQEHAVDIKIGEMPQQTSAQTERKQLARQANYGMSLAPITANDREAYGIPTSVHGVLVTDVSSGSATDENGLEAGDVIVRIGKERVAEPETAIAKLNEAKAARKPAMLLISRKGESIFIAVEAKDA